MGLKDSDPVFTATGRDSLGSRRVHFVGSLPEVVSSTPLDGISWTLSHCDAENLTSLPCDRDPEWIVRYLRSLERAPSLVKIKGGEFSGYDDFPRYRVARACELSSDELALGRVAEVRLAMTDRARVGDSLPALQVSIPSPIDLAVFTFGKGPLALRTAPVFAEAIRAEISEIARTWGSHAVFQVETPMVLATLNVAPQSMWLALSRLFARNIASLVQSAPRSKFTVHLCYGDLHHKPLLVPSSLRPAVLFTNAMVAAISKRRLEIPTVGIPACHGDGAPATDRSFYAALSSLEPSVKVIAGLVAERHPAASATALDRFEEALKRRVYAVSAACGLGRRSVEDAETNVELAQHLAMLPAAVAVSGSSGSGGGHA